MIKKQGTKYSVWSEDGKKRLGKPSSKKQAVKRLRQVEYFKHHDKSQTYDDHNNIVLKKSYAEFMKSIVTSHIDENKTVNTQEVFKTLGLDYKKFMGVE